MALDTAELYAKYERDRRAQAEDAPPEPTDIRGWKTYPGKRTVELTPSGEPDGAPSRRLPVGLQLLRLVRDIETQRIVGADVRVSLPKNNEVLTKDVEMPREAAGRAAAEVWTERAVTLAPDRARVAARWLSDAFGQLDAPERLTLTRPAWDGDRLYLPPAQRVAGCSASEAELAWSEVVRTVKHQDLDGVAIALGASVISPQLQRLGRAGFTIHLRDDSSTGKTRTGKVALAVWEEPPEDGAEPNWDLTRNGLTEALESRALLPQLLDDTGTVNARDPSRFLADALFAIAQGHPRQRHSLTDGGGQEGDRKWRLVAISTGETPILDAARVGAAARAIEVGGPFMPDAETADRLFDLARSAHGWPGKWLTEGRWPVPELPALTAPSRVGQRLAPTVAACAVGFAELCRVVNADFDAAAIGQRVLDRLAEELAERGETAAERFWTALLEDVAANPGLYPDDSSPIPEGLGRGLRGVRRAGYLYLFKGTAAELAERKQCSLRTVLRDLEVDGRHVVLTPTRDRRERISVGGTQVDTYAFVPNGQLAPAEPVNS